MDPDFANILGSDFVLLTSRQNDLLNCKSLDDNHPAAAKRTQPGRLLFDRGLYPMRVALVVSGVTWTPIIGHVLDPWNPGESWTPIRWHIAGLIVFFLVGVPN